MAKSGKHYVDKKKMHEVLLDWKIRCKEAEAQGKQLPRVPEYIGDAIRLIAVNLAKAPNFANYSYKEEMIGDGIENCLMYIGNFDPVRFNNPFGYFTKIIYYAFLRRISKEKKQTYIKLKVMSNDMVFNNLVEGSKDGEQFNSVKMTYDASKMADLEKLFEKKPVKKKAKQEELVE